MHKVLTKFYRSRSSQTFGWQLVAASASLFTGIQTARALGPHDRGALGLALSLAGLGVLLSAMGTNVSIRRHLPTNRRVSVPVYSSVSLILFPIALLVLFALTLLLSNFIDPIFNDLSVGVAFVIYGMSFFVSNQCLDLLNAQGRVSLSARVNAMGSICCFVLIFLFWQLGLGLTWFILAYAFSVAFQVLVSVLYISKSIIERSSGYSKLSGIRLLLKDGFRLLGLNLGQTLTYRADTIILGAMSSSMSVGYYAVATTPASLLRLPVNAIGQVAFADAAKGIRAVSVLKKIAFVELMLLPLAAVGLGLADWAIVLVFGTEFAPASAALRVLIIAELCLVPFLIAGRALAGGGSRRGASFSGLIGVVVLVIGCLILVPDFAEVGAAWASVAAYGSMSITAIIFLLWPEAKRDTVL